MIFGNEEEDALRQELDQLQARIEAEEAEEGEEGNEGEEGEEAQKEEPEDVAAELSYPSMEGEPDHPCRASGPSEVA